MANNNYNAELEVFKQRVKSELLREMENRIVNLKVALAQQKCTYKDLGVEIQQIWGITNRFHQEVMNGVIKEHSNGLYDSVDQMMDTIFPKEFRGQPQK